MLPLVDKVYSEFLVLLAVAVISIIIIKQSPIPVVEEGRWERGGGVLRIEEEASSSKNCLRRGLYHDAPKIFGEGNR